MKNSSTPRFVRLWAQLQKLGYVAVPSATGKQPAIRWAPYSYNAKGEFRPKLDKAGWKRVLRRFAHVDKACWVLDSHPDPSMHLINVDIDKANPALLDWVLANFGRSPLIVTSGRGWHVYYRAPLARRTSSSAGLIGPTDSFEHRVDDDGKVTLPLVSPIDVKGSAAYAIAPGSWHAKRGREYEIVGDVELTEDLIRSLPVFDTDTYESMVAETKQKRAEYKRGTQPQKPVRATSSIIGKTKNPVTGPSSTIPSDTQIQTVDGVVGTIESIGGGFQSGDYVSCFCPMHHNTDSPAASLRRFDDGTLRLTCWGGCSTSYAVVDPVFSTGAPVDLDQLDADGQKVSAPTADPRWGGAGVRRFLPNELVKGRYLPQQKPVTRLLLLRAGLGTGKTAYASWLASETDGDVVAVSPRRTLVDDMVRRFGGKLKDYRKIAGRISGSVAICLDSIHRINLIDVSTGKIVGISGRRIPLLVLDEIRTIRHSLTSGCMDPYERSRCLEQLRYLLFAADQILIADALAEPEDLAWIARLARIDTEDAEVWVAPPPAQWTYHVSTGEIPARA